MTALPALLALLVPGAEAGPATPTQDGAAASEGAAVNTASGPPRNLIAAALVLQDTIDTMWRWSPTFKAQCARLEATSLVRVEIRFGAESQRLGARAMTRLVRGVGGTKVEIYYVVLDPRAGAELVELIAHELEHVIEQLDDVELAASERHGVRETRAGVFETTRAIHIGRKVRREVNEAGQGRGTGAAVTGHDR